ncbi:MAG TPA: GxxExxY protein [Burkholderiales bacterium]
MNTASPLPMEMEDLSRALVDAAFKVHQALGPGLLESVYEACLRVELDKRGISFETQTPVQLIYEGLKVDPGLRLDFLVEKSIILELKSVEKLLPIHHSQLLTYLKLTNLRLGLLINFNVAMFKQGIVRIIR